MRARQGSAVQDFIARASWTAYCTHEDKDYLRPGLMEAWPDQDDPDGVEVLLFRHGYVVLPIGIDDMLTYGSDDISGALVLPEANSNHEAVRMHSYQDGILSLLRRCYDVEIADAA